MPPLHIHIPVNSLVFVKLQTKDFDGPLCYLGLQRGVLPGVMLWSKCVTETCWARL